MKSTHIMTAFLLCMVLLASCTSNNNSDKQNTNPGVTKSDFALLGCNTGALWKNLISKGYITSTGAITISFRALTSADDMKLDAPFARYHEKIFTILKQDIDNPAAAQSDFSYLTLDVDALFVDLKNNGYINSAGVIATTFRNLTNADDMILGNAFEYYRNNIYTILKQDIANATASKSDLSSLGCDTDALFDDLETQGYINSAGVITSTFRNLTSASQMTLSAAFIIYRADIFNTLHQIIDNITAAKSDFSSIGCDIDALLDDLKTQGYINSAGVITPAFRNLTSASQMILSTEYTSYRAAIFNILQQCLTVSESDFTSLTFDVDALWNSLLANGYITSTGEITNSFKGLSDADEMTLDSEFEQYRDDIFSVMRQAAAE